ncbi:hypothetical protein HBI81_139170 [Parastagonospora nodorum]|nr:hypothetical protein HBH68_136350 [Parastagonospora nodorum]KAH5352529.1 hypothetical protein HBI48_150030 [Parastagonospora nodorum]KAH5491669.1 hypothetical protein HBI52_218110 [Parastagonospora nodorum]KAH6008484.1 hypothetical protein HBI83_175700 [Parastagonospora nodorum]KAH6068660.1 hypothetical protein HBI66_142150 [Parastagonospora nodorum]
MVASPQDKRYDNAKDVRTIIDIVKGETGIEELPGFGLLQWHYMSRNSGILGDEKLAVGKLNGQDAFACLRMPPVDDKYSLRANLIKLITGDGVTTSQVEPSMLGQIVYAPIFKHIRCDTGTASQPDCPIKAFMVACFVLRGHTHDKPLKPRALFRVGLITALKQYEQTILLKGKRKDLAGATSASSTASAFNGKSVTPAVESDKGHHVEDVRSHLQKKLGSGTLPYISDLGWEPSSLAGAPEKLRIGTRCHAAVFAIFNPRAHPAQQLNIIQAGKGRLRIEIQRAGMASVKYDEPYSHLGPTGKDMPVTQIKALAQTLRTYLKGLFALRGHSEGRRICIDLQSLTRTISTIRMAGYGIGTGSGKDAADTTEPMLDGILDTIEGSRAETKNEGSSTATDTPTRAFLQVRSSSRSASTTTTPRANIARSHTKDTSQASEDNMFDMGNGESSTSRWSAIDLPAQKSGTGLYGIFSKANWASNTPKILQTPLESGSRVVHLTSPSSSDTESVTPDCLAESDDRLEMSSSHLMIPEPDILPELRSSKSPTPQIVPSTNSSMFKELSTMSIGAQDPDQDSVIGDDPSEDAPTHKLTPGELVDVMTNLAKDGSNDVRSAWLKDFITIRTHQTLIAGYHQQVQAYEEQISDLHLKIPNAKSAAKQEEDEASKACDDTLRDAMNGPRPDLTTSLDVLSDAVEAAKLKSKDISARLQAEITAFEGDISAIEAKKAQAQTQIEHAALEQANAKKRKAETDDDDLMETIMMDMVDAGRNMGRAEKKRKVT